MIASYRKTVIYYRAVHNSTDDLDEYEEAIREYMEKVVKSKRLQKAHSIRDIMEVKSASRFDAVTGHSDDKAQ